MKVTSLKENLHRPLSLVSRYISSRPPLPVLANVLLEATNDGLTLSATNLDVTVKAHIPAKAESPGKTTVPARAFAETVATLPSGKVEISLQGEQINLTTESTESSFNTISAQDFPVLPAFDQTKAIALPLSALAEVSDKVLFAASTDESRPVLTTLLLQQQADKLVFVATDGFRLSMVTKPVDSINLSEHKQLLLPAKIIAELIKIGTETQADTLWIDLVSQANQIALKVSDIEVYSKLIDADYPDYQRIMPSGFTTTMTVDQPALAQAVKMASIFARDAGSLIKLHIEPDKKSVTIMAQSASLGQNHSSISADGAGEEVMIAVNAKYLQDALAAFGDAPLQLQCKGPLAPLMMTHPDQPDFQHIIMPIKVEG